MKDIKDQSIAQEAYEFISEELTYYPDLPQYTAEELAEHKDDKELWDKLEEELDCFRICDACGAPMLDGFLVHGADHYQNNYPVIFGCGICYNHVLLF
jgi:hypothetical protein